MKLKNKKTGEIVVFGEGIVDLTNIGCKNVAEMMEQGWEDYEEKDHYYIEYDGDIMIVEALDYEPKIKVMKQIGNYFENKEDSLVIYCAKTFISAIFAIIFFCFKIAIFNF